MVVSTLFYWSSTVFNVIVKSTLTVFKPEPIQLWSSLVADFQWLFGAIYFPMPMKSECSPIRYIDPQDWYQRCNNQNTVGVRKWVKNWRRWPIENGWKMGFHRMLADQKWVSVTNQYLASVCLTQDTWMGRCWLLEPVGRENPLCAPILIYAPSQWSPSGEEDERLFIYLLLVPSLSRRRRHLPLISL